MKTLIKFLPSIFFTLLILIIKETAFAQILHPKIWIILIFFVALDSLVYTLADKGLENNSANFIAFYLSSVVLRIILMLIFIGVMVYLYPEFKKLLVLNTFVLYLCFMIFEILIILRKLRRF